jgi:hypothetical protein
MVLVNNLSIQASIHGKTAVEKIAYGNRCIVTPVFCKCVCRTLARQPEARRDCAKAAGKDMHIEAWPIRNEVTMTYL